MDDQDAVLLNAALLGVLRESAPWAAQQVDESVRQGKPIAKRVRRRGKRVVTETVAPTRELGHDEFVETTVLTATEQLRLTVDAIERLLVDPAAILEEVTGTFGGVGISKVEFAEPDEAGRSELGKLASSTSPQHRERISSLLNRLRSDVNSVG